MMRPLLLMFLLVTSGCLFADDSLAPQRAHLQVVGLEHWWQEDTYQVNVTFVNRAAVAIPVDGSSASFFFGFSENDYRGEDPRFAFQDGVEIIRPGEANASLVLYTRQYAERLRDQGHSVPNLPLFPAHRFPPGKESVLAFRFNLDAPTMSGLEGFYEWQLDILHSDDERFAILRYTPGCFNLDTDPYYGAPPGHRRCMYANQYRDVYGL